MPLSNLSDAEREILRWSHTDSLSSLADAEAVLDDCVFALTTPPGVVDLDRLATWLPVVRRLV